MHAGATSSTRACNWNRISDYLGGSTVCIKSLRADALRFAQVHSEGLFIINKVSVKANPQSLYSKSATPARRYDLARRAVRPPSVKLELGKPKEANCCSVASAVGWDSLSQSKFRLCAPRNLRWRAGLKDLLAPRESRHGLEMRAVCVTTCDLSARSHFRPWREVQKPCLVGGQQGVSHSMSEGTLAASGFRAPSSPCPTVEV